MLSILLICYILLLSIFIYRSNRQLGYICLFLTGLSGSMIIYSSFFYVPEKLSTPPREIQYIEDPTPEQGEITKEQKEYLLALGCDPVKKETEEKIRVCNSFGCYSVKKYEWDYSGCFQYKNFQKKSRMPASIQILPARFIQYTTVKKTKQKINKNHHWQGGL